MPNDAFERRLAEALRDLEAPRVPDYLATVKADVRRVAQRTAWTLPERWLPMTVISRRATVASTPRLAWVLLVLGLMLAIGAGAALVGSRLSALVSPAPGGAGLLVYGADGDIYTMRDDGSDRQRLTSSTAFEWAPVWSPDGTLIAFYSDPDGDPGKGDPPTIDVMDANGSNLHAVSGDIPITSSYWRSIGWSPDSRRLVFADEKPFGSSLYVVDADGSHLQRLDVGTDTATTPAWSPDGSLIAFRGSVATAFDKTGVYVVDPQGLGARQVSAAGLDDGEAWSWPKWSADSTQVVFAYNGAGRHRVGVATVDGSARDISDAAFDELDPTWSPDGRFVAVRRYLDSDWSDTYLYDMTDGSEVRLDLPKTMTGPASWSPDGTRLLIDGPPIEGAPDGQGHFLVAAIDGSAPPVPIEVMWSSDTAKWPVP